MKERQDFKKIDEETQTRGPCMFLIVTWKVTQIFVPNSDLKNDPVVYTWSEKDLSRHIYNINDL